TGVQTCALPISHATTPRNADKLRHSPVADRRGAPRRRRPAVRLENVCSVLSATAEENRTPISPCTFTPTGAAARAHAPRTHTTAVPVRYLMCTTCRTVISPRRCARVVTLGVRGPPVGGPATLNQRVAHLSVGPAPADPNCLRPLSGAGPFFFALGALAWCALIAWVLVAGVDSHLAPLEWTHARRGPALFEELQRRAGPLPCSGGVAGGRVQGSSAYVRAALGDGVHQAPL